MTFHHPVSASVDWEVFGKLAEDVGHPPAVDFACSFGEMLPRRAAALVSAVDAKDDDVCLTVLLSIQSGAIMLGAEALTRITETILRELDAPHRSWVGVRQQAGTPLTKAINDFLRTVIPFLGHTGRIRPPQQRRW